MNPTDDAEDQMPRFPVVKKSEAISHVESTDERNFSRGHAGPD